MKKGIVEGIMKKGIVEGIMKKGIVKRRALWREGCCEEKGIVNGRTLWREGCCGEKGVVKRRALWREGCCEEKGIVKRRALWREGYYVEGHCERVLWKGIIVGVKEACIIEKRIVEGHCGSKRRALWKSIVKEHCERALWKSIVKAHRGGRTWWKDIVVEQKNGIVERQWKRHRGGRTSSWRNMASNNAEGGYSTVK
jgi:hypothetical protein